MFFLLLLITLFFNSARDDANTMSGSSTALTSPLVNIQLVFVNNVFSGFIVCFICECYCFLP